MKEFIDQKNEHLGRLLRQMNKVMVAFSGGADSTFVLKRAQQELGEHVVAVVAASETFPAREYDAAVKLAKSFGVQLLETKVSELANDRFAANNPDRCYHCKTGLYSHLRQIAAQHGYPYILDGSNVSDLGDYRPGLKAKTEQGIRSVLQEAGLTKDEIRRLSKQMGLPTWNKPSFACLSSRIPYGTKIDQQKINQLDIAEQFLFDLGFHQIRVRHHENIARIETEPHEMAKIIQHREEITQQFQKIGFQYVTLDLKGYRTGSMNEVLSASIKQKAGQ